MLLFLLQTASLGQSLILSPDSCYTPLERKKIAGVIIENDFLKKQDSLKTVIISKSEEKLALGDTIIQKQKSIIFKQDEEIVLTKEEIKRLNTELKQTKGEKLFLKIINSVIGTGILSVSGILLYATITR